MLVHSVLPPPLEAAVAEVLGADRVGHVDGDVWRADASWALQPDRPL